MAHIFDMSPNYTVQKFQIGSNLDSCQEYEPYNSSLFFHYDNVASINISYSSSHSFATDLKHFKGLSHSLTALEVGISALLLRSFKLALQLLHHAILPLVSLADLRSSMS